MPQQGKLPKMGPNYENLKTFHEVKTSLMAPNFLIWVEIVDLQVLGNLKGEKLSILAFLP